MVTVGLTGGIASGKSTVSVEFGKLGARIIDADQIARALIRPHTPLWRKIVARFGKEIQRGDSTVDRAELGRRVFAHREEREALNEMMHPEIKKEIQRRRKEFGKEVPHALVLVDAALLIETGAFREMDRTIVVSASERNQLRRLVERDGLSPEEARRRIGVQMPLREKLKHADYVINTDCSMEEIRKQVRRIYRELSSVRAKGGTHQSSLAPLSNYER